MKDKVQENLLSNPKHWFELEKRKKMAAWMNGYMKEVIELADEETKQKIKSEIDQYESLKQKQVCKIEELSQDQYFTNLLKKDKKTYVSWLNSKPELKPLRYILNKLYDFKSFENIPKFELRRSVFKNAFGRK